MACTPCTRVLCVEDDEMFRSWLRAVLTDAGCTVSMAGTGEEFRRQLEECAPDWFVIDLNLPDASGLHLLQFARERRPEAACLVLTGSTSVADAVQAMKLGATDFLTKPVEAERLQVSVRNILRISSQALEIERLRADIREGYSPEHLVGSSAAMDAVRHLIRQAASVDASVLVRGETGTGKELVARAIHHASARRNGPFVDVNSAALTPTLLESELFGHEKGAFTGASGLRRGAFELADGGTLFLDEIGDMPTETQATILRVLQEQRFRRVGGERPIQVNVRIISATNQDIEKAIAEGRFRRDLLYRINALTIDLAPLRERPRDISDLARHFLSRISRNQRRTARELSPEAVALMSRHSWPGNVRELEHVMERAALLCEGEYIEPRHLPLTIAGDAVPAAPGAPPKGLLEAVEQVERTMILDALKRRGGSKVQAAADLGITRRMITYKMINLGLTRP